VPEVCGAPPGTARGRPGTVHRRHDHPATPTGHHPGTTGHAPGSGRPPTTASHRPHPERDVVERDVRRRFVDRETALPRPPPLPASRPWAWVGAPQAGPGRGWACTGVGRLPVGPVRRGWGAVGWAAGRVHAGRAGREVWKVIVVATRSQERSKELVARRWEALERAGARMAEERAEELRRGRSWTSWWRISNWRGRTRRRSPPRWRRRCVGCGSGWRGCGERRRGRWWRWRGRGDGGWVCAAVGGGRGAGEGVAPVGAGGRGGAGGAGAGEVGRGFGRGPGAGRGAGGVAASVPASQLVRPVWGGVGWCPSIPWPVARRVREVRGWSAELDPGETGAAPALSHGRGARGVGTARCAGWGQARVVAGAMRRVAVARRWRARDERRGGARGSGARRPKLGAWLERRTAGVL